MKRFHMVFGFAAVFVFLLTGQYMALYQDHLRGMADLPRLLFRSRHIYILLASLLNLILGAYLRRTAGWRGRLQMLGSILIIIATCSLVAAFIYEPRYPDLGHTPFSFYGIIPIAVGTLAHTIAGMSDKYP